MLKTIFTLTLFVAAIGAFAQSDRLLPVQVGDSIQERHMCHFEKTEVLRAHTDKVIDSKTFSASSSSSAQMSCRREFSECVEIDRRDPVRLGFIGMLLDVSVNYACGNLNHCFSSIQIVPGKSNYLGYRMGKKTSEELRESVCPALDHCYLEGDTKLNQVRKGRIAQLSTEIECRSSIVPALTADEISDAENTYRDYAKNQLRVGDIIAHRFLFNGHMEMSTGEVIAVDEILETVTLKQLSGGGIRSQIPRSVPIKLVPEGHGFKRYDVITDGDSVYTVNFVSIDGRFFMGWQRGREQFVPLVNMTKLVL
jgi:hypothetical protein